MVIEDEDTGQLPGINLDKAHMRQLPRGGPVAIMVLGAAITAFSVAAAITDFSTLSLSQGVLILVGISVGLTTSAFGTVWLRDVGSHEAWRPTVIKMGVAADAIPQVFKLLKEVPGLLKEILKLLKAIDPAAVGQVAAMIQQQVARAQQRETERQRRELILKAAVDDTRKLIVEALEEQAGAIAYVREAGSKRLQNIEDAVAEMPSKLATMVAPVVEEAARRGYAAGYTDAVAALNNGGRVLYPVRPRKDDHS